MNTCLPETIKVGPYTLNVGFEPFLAPSGLRGHCNTDELTISLREGMPPPQLVATLFHELIHAVDNVFAVGLEEAQTERLANGLLDALQGIGWAPKEFTSSMPPPPGFNPDAANSLLR